MLPFSPTHLPERFRDARVLEAMERVPRAPFIPESSRGQAGCDVALCIGHGQTISQPFIVAYMTSALEVQTGDRVLEIGTGSGYQTGILSALGAEVFTIELIPELSRMARETLERLGLAENVHFRVGDGRHGWPSYAPFERVICAASPPSIPVALIEQVKVGGRLVIPAGPRDAQILYVLEKTPEDLHEIARLDVRFVPLVRPPIEA